MENQNIQEIEATDFIENLPFSVFLLNSEKNIFYCNSIAEIYLNKSKKALLGTNFLNLFSITESIQKDLNEMISNVINFDLSEMLTFKFINDDNEETWVELFFSSINKRNMKYVQIILQDITEKKLVEEIIKEENIKLRELNQLKKQLTEQISENLKSPLNNIFEISEILLNSYKDQLDHDVLRLLELIRNGGEKSLNMVGKIFNISQIESDSFELNMQTENLIDIIKNSIDEINDRANFKHINLNLNDIEVLYSEVDKIRIKQVFKHILLNATNSGSSKLNISVSINEINSNVVISIILKNFNTKVVKTTLNLKVPKQIIELHGGQLIVNSEKKKKKLDLIITIPVKNWKDSLIHIYIIYKSGIPLYDYSFIKNKENIDASLISGGIIGMITILKAIIQGKKQIKTIDHGDRKLMFETNKTNDIIFVLMVKEDLMIFRNKLISLIIGFDNIYQDLLKNIENSSIFCENWDKLQFLINKYFK
ncbi:MAG: PAS domain-containing protein [Promethearchaeota archaeon]